MSKINIIEYIPDKTSQFNIKRYKIGNRSFDVPEKTFDTKFITQKSFNVTGKKEIIENSKYVKRFSQIKEIFTTEDDKKIEKFFQDKKWAEDFFHINNITFCFNPFLEENYKEVLDSFLDYLHGHSKEVLVIPNITKKIISIDDYIKFVDYCHGILSSMNSKPIFVPISIRFGMEGINKLIEHYIKNEFYYIWFDFEGKPINKSTSSRIRRIRRLIDQKNVFDKVLLYFTNIKREIISNPKSDNSASSDILSTIGGANILGINREPQRFDPNNKTERLDPKEIWIHKARFFDSDTYYYKKFAQNTTIEPKNINIINNSHKIRDELKKQTEIFLENYKIRDYVIKKPIIQENPFISKILLG
jgi:hypothetical protein